MGCFVCFLAFARDMIMLNIVWCGDICLVVQRICWRRVATVRWMATLCGILINNGQQQWLRLFNGVWCVLCNVLVNACNVEWSNVHILIILYNSGKPPEAADQCTPLLAQATTIESLHTIPLLDHRPVLKNHQPEPVHFSSETI